MARTSWGIRRKYYIFPGVLPDNAMQSIPDAQIIRTQKLDAVVAPATVSAYQAIRKLGMTVPSPVHDKDWRFTGHFKPMTHQIKTVASILAHQRSFVLDDPGTGKTNSAIWAMQAWFERDSVRRVLIVAPLSIVHGVWLDNLFVHTDWRVADLTKKTRDARLRLAQDTRYNVLLANPQVLHNLEGILPEVDAIIVDEATSFKAHSSRQTKALQKIIDTQNNPYVVFMTGTPAPQGPPDAYRLIKFINPRAERLTFRAWRDMTMQQVSEFTWRPRQSSKETLTEWLQPGTRTSREQALDLPPLFTFERHYTLTKAQKEAIRTMRDEAMATIDGEKISAANAAVAASKALQILTGNVRTGNGEDVPFKDVSIDAKSWLDAVEEVVAERHAPVLIFVPFKRAAQRLAEHLDCPCITGDVNQEARKEVYRQINEESLRAVVAVAQTMSHGLTLTGANCVLWALPPVGAEQYNQANARAYRNGQTRPVDIIHLIGHPFVKALFQRTDDRVKLQQAVLDALSEI